MIVCWFGRVIGSSLTEAVTTATASYLFLLFVDNLQPIKYDINSHRL